MFKISCAACLIIIFAASAGSLTAGEIDVGLADILSLTSSNEQISVLVFLKDQVDINSISAEFDFQGAEIADRHETVVRALQSLAAAARVQYWLIYKFPSYGSVEEF